MQLLNKVVRNLFNLSVPLSGSLLHEIHISTQLIIDSIELTIYQPITISANYPAILYLHGGGWVLGSVKAYDRILRQLCQQANCIVIAVNYRKAPEHPFPTALNDCVTSYQWLANNLTTLKINPERIIIAGDSAGGNLTLGLWQHLYATEIIKPSLLILIYPLLDPTALINFKPSRWNIIHHVSHQVLNYFLKQYLGDSNQSYPAEISFINQFDKTISYPDIVILTAEWDALTPSIHYFVKQLNIIHSEVTIKQYPRTLHGFLNFARFSKQAKVMLQDIVESIAM